MTRLLSLAVSVSRFRFWIYTGGTYVVGYALGMGSWEAFFLPAYTVYLVYFFFPANLFIYGVNDWWDRETDRLNPKKGGKEHLLRDRERRDLFGLLAAVSALSLLLLLVQTPPEMVVFSTFLFLAYFYSAPPLRFKDVPVLDFSSNMLYIMPGVFGYLLAAGSLPPLALLAAGYFHIAAMHLFSAVPDIAADRAAGVRTTAVVLGERRSLLLCLLFWSVFAALVIVLAGFHPLSFAVLLFPAVPLALLTVRTLKTASVYWYLPYLNTGLGGLAFAAVTLSKVV
ncbi:prenyltransferase [Methanofollis sp. UBA420]|jgi:4-hydroxybenzoate polyprenyltransferase|uniref:prenyltransferase n=1 Tax=Methanofollis sp. UBA420 TaxID=1915514 RepID=UPI00316AC645